MVKPITPRTGFGNPKSDACSVLITEPQESTGLMSQFGTKSGSLDTDFLNNQFNGSNNADESARQQGSKQFVDITEFFVTSVSIS
jgi:hypothetical protein